MVTMTSASTSDMLQDRHSPMDDAVSVASAQAAKTAAAAYGAAQVEDGMRIGIGTGTTAEIFIRLLGQRVREGLDIRVTSTSQRSAEIAQHAGIVVEELDRVGQLDLTIDGADEVNQQKELIKGGGGALLREKIVAATSDRFVVIVDKSKVVDTLGAFPLPIEVIQFGKTATRTRICAELRKCGYADFSATWRETDGQAFVTDEGNSILDLHLGTIGDADQLDRRLNAIPGVVETGLFVNMASVCVCGNDKGQVDVW